MADFGVKLVNPFDLLEDDSAEADVPEEVAAPAKPKPPVRLPKQSDKPAAKPVAPVEEKASPIPNGRGGPVHRGSPGDRGGRGGRGRGGYDRDGPPRPPRDATNTEGGEGGYGGDRRPRSGDRGRGRGRGGGRGGGDGDRHPRNGFQETIKREGQGKGNWGSDQEAIKDAEKAEAGEEVKGEETVVEEEPAVAEEAPPPPPEEEKEMTLDEYEKILEERRANLNKVTPKKPYKVDEKEFKGLKIHTKKDVEDDVVLELTNKKAIGARKAGLVEKSVKEKTVIEGNFRFADANSSERGRGRGPRGGRGRGRFEDGDRPRYPPRDREFRGPPPERNYNGGGGSYQPRITDESSFPALAPKVTAAN